ncbi:hypothetical protein KR093_006925, partial [Drosophila rubida]
AGDAPSSSPSTFQQPTTLFKWLSLNNLPMLEDETPPASFFEVMGSAEVAFHCSQCSRLLVSLDVDALQRTTGTQTQVLHMMQAQTQTHQQHTQTEREPSDAELAMEAQLEWHLQQLRRRRRGHQHAFNHQMQQQQLNNRHFMWQWQWQQRQYYLWQLLKTLLIWISVINGCYLLCRGLLRLSIWRRILISIDALEETPPMPPPSISWPTLIYRKLRGLGRMLHII